jgi:cyclomaltodextrinase
VQALRSTKSALHRSSRPLVLGIFALTISCAVPTAEAEPWIALATMDSDVWAHARALEGTAPASCARIRVVCTNESGVCSAGPIVRSGEAFHTTVDLAQGDNELVASCELRAGRSVASEPVTWRVPRELVDAMPERRPLHALPAWSERAVVYGAVPELFAAEGGLRAIEARLDVLRSIGIDTLWLSPIHPSPEGDYGYAVLDPFAVREQLGGESALRALVEAAHARRMRVLLDLVPNHLSEEHPYFAHARENGRRSPYWAYFERDADGAPTHYFDWDGLPNLDYGNAEVRGLVRSLFVHWARELDVDGFRIDAAWGVQRRAPDFFAALEGELHAIDPELLLIAEASAREPGWGAAGFAAYDWTDEVGQWAWRDAFGEDGTVDVGALRAALAGASAQTLRFLDNNDTGDRFRTRHGASAYGAASALLFALPGIPAVFTGDEVAATYAPYEQTEPLDLTGPIEATLARRIAVRRAHGALTKGALTLVETDPSVLGFVRRADDGGAPILVLVELGGQPLRARVHLAPLDRASFAGSGARDLLGERDVALRAREDALEIDLAPYEALLLEGTP